MRSRAQSELLINRKKNYSNLKHCGRINEPQKIEEIQQTGFKHKQSRYNTGNSSDATKAKKQLRIINEELKDTFIYDAF